MSAARVMPARFASTCGGCGEPIAPGAEIRYVPGFAANHERCGDPTTAAPSRGARRSRPAYGRGRTVIWSRCTHEDYPCCGCER